MLIMARSVAEYLDKYDKTAYVPLPVQRMWSIRLGSSLTKMRKVGVNTVEWFIVERKENPMS